jgi:hypothetical protein
VASEQAQKIFSFTDWTKNHPSDRVPGDRIDAQFANHERAINELKGRVDVLLRADGRINNGLLTPESFPKAILDDIVARALLAVRGVVDEARGVLAGIEERDLAASVLVGTLRAMNAQASDELGRAVAIAEAVLAAQRRLDAVRHDVLTALDTASLPPPALGYTAGGFYGVDPQGASATAQDYAQVSIEWAEHMPDPIPPNVLAINAITGDHWSSRWWANRSANAFGMLAWWYMGAWPSPGPPTTPMTPTNQPIPPGAMYYDTTHGAMMVWNGSTWVNNAAPSKAATTSLYYLSAAGQTVFPLSAADRAGKTFAFNQSAPEGLQALVNGVRLEPAFDFTVDTVASSITFLRSLTLAAVVCFDILTPASQLTPSGTVNTVLLNPIVPDGVRTNFTGLTVAMNGHAVNVAKNEELQVSVDGVIQQPGGAYTASGASVTFSEAPPASALIFITWFGPANP